MQDEQDNSPTRNYPLDVWLRAHILETINGFSREVAEKMAIDEYKKEKGDER